MEKNPAVSTGEWTRSQAAGYLAALGTQAPLPLRYVIFRSTMRPSGSETAGYLLPGMEGRRDEATFERWLVQEKLLGADRVAVSVLVIREGLNEDGAVHECTIERRRGGSNWPLYGNPARVQFLGAARQVAVQRVLPNGRLTAPDHAPLADNLPLGRACYLELFETEEEALRAQFGPTAVPIEHREPGLLEARVGLNSMIHIRMADGRILGCGIGWHGTVPFVLVIDIPMLHIDVALTPTDEKAVADVIRTHDLVRHETRLDAAGIAVMASTRDGHTFFALRPSPVSVLLEPYFPAATELGSADQRRWLHYAQAFESQTVLDLYMDHGSDDMVAVTGSSDGVVSRRYIDVDGVEVAREPAYETMAGTLYRSSLESASAEVAPPDATPAVPTAEPVPVPGDPELAELRFVAPADSLLTVGLCYNAARSRLAGVRAAAREPLTIGALDQLRALWPTFHALGANLAAGATRVLIQQFDQGRLTAPELAAAIGEVESGFVRELAELKVTAHAEGLPEPSW